MGGKRTKKSTGVKASEKKHRMVLVGLGRIGLNHFRTIKESPRFKLVAVVDPKKTLAVPLNEQETKHCKSLKELEGISFDCAVIATPTGTHHKIAEWFLNKKCGLLVEKPLCYGSDLCKDLTAAISKKKAKVVVGHVERFNPAVIKLKEVLEHGWIGTPIHFSFTRVGGYPQNVEDNNNVLVDLAVHDLDVLQLIYGKMDLKSSVCHQSLNKGIYDTAEILLSAPKGASASIHVNWITPTKIRTIRVTGSKGVAVVDYMLQTCKVYGGNLLPRPEPKLDYSHLLSAYQNSDQIEFGVKREEPLKIQLEHFANFLEGKANDCCTPAEATYTVIRAEQAIYDSKK